MPIHPLKRIEDKVRDIVQMGDYLLYLLLNFFKFKPFPKEIKRILVIELFNIGDIIVITPVLQALRQRYPFAEIDVLVKKDKQDVLTNHTSINNIVPYTTFSKTRAALKQKEYDLAILLHPGSLKISALLFLAGIKYRVGCAKAGITYGKGFFLHKKVFPNNAWQHKIKDNLDVVRAIKIQPTRKKIELSISPQAEKKIKSMLAKKKHPLIGINAPSQHKTQRWYPERFAEVANYLIEKHKATIVFTGVEKEQDQVEEIISQIPTKEKVLNLTGKTTFEELKALIKHLDLLITVDSSVTHLASAFDTPVLTLFGPTIPTFWGPTGKNSTFIWKEKESCVGCRRYSCVYHKDHECMKSITSQEVIEKVKLLLAKKQVETKSR